MLCKHVLEAFTVHAHICTLVETRTVVGLFVMKTNVMILINTVMLVLETQSAQIRFRMVVRWGTGGLV